MRCFIGIDLGSTTTKAVVIDENQNVIGRGITNSRSNYDTAAKIAQQIAEAEADYVLALKDNHPTLRRDVRLWLDTEAAKGALPVHEAVEKDRGRIEIRACDGAPRRFNDTAAESANDRYHRLYAAQGLDVGQAERRPIRGDQPADRRRDA